MVLAKQVGGVAALIARRHRRVDLLRGVDVAGVQQG
jgi:hypothetical protein